MRYAAAALLGASACASIRVVICALMGATATAYVAPAPRNPRHPLRASAYKDNLGREVSAERIEMLKEMGYVFDEERQSWTKPPDGRPKRRPALARALSARILEVRIADAATDAEAQAARDAAAKLQEVVREADTATAATASPREALESLGRTLAFRPVVGPLVLTAAQLALWAACRPDDAVLGDAFTNRLDVWAAAPGGYIALAACALVFAGAAANVRASATPWFGRVAGALEATAADGAAGALGPDAPRSWRAADVKWRSVAQVLEFAAAGPRVAALHGGLQVALVESARALQPAPIDATGEGLAALTGIGSVALFAFVAETLRTSDDDNVLRAENEAVRASLKSKAGDEALHRAVCLAWLDRFPDPPDGGRALPPLGAAVRAAAAGSALALTNGDLLAPLALHAVAGALAAAAPLSPGPDDVQDPDRAVVTVGASP